MSPGPETYVVGSDIGGTFTDLALLNEATGEVTIAKVVTHPADPSTSVLAGVEALGQGEPGYVSRTSEFIHATTLVANAVIQRKGAKTALLATKGFRDVLELRRHVRVKNTEMWNDPPDPLVPRYLRIPVTERVYSDGRVLVPLDEEEVRRIAAFLSRESVESVAVAFLHSYVNDSHERRVGDLLTELLPEATISLSSQVMREFKEYERTATTVVNAYVQPIARQYLHRLGDGLDQRGFRSSLLVNLSSGGLASVGTAVDFPLRVIESGPVAGVVAARTYAGLAGLDQVLSLDMGGTTAKACLIMDGEVPVTSELEVARSERLQRGSGYPVGVPSVDLIEVGAGGGSIARVNDLGLVQVGPESAGADPGPICYGFGGGEPTVTDADLVLGYLDPDYFLGGEMRLDPEAAVRGLTERLARPLDRDLVDVARTVHRVVNETMASAVKMHVIEKGGDPARAALVAFGGAGPVHAYNLARALGMRRVMVPMQAGVMSAQGLLHSPPAFDLTRTYKTPFDDLDHDSMKDAFAETEREVAGFLGQVDAAAEVHFSRWLEVCYIGQGYQIPLRVSEEDLGPELRQTLRGRFAEEYRAKYGYFYDDVPGEVVSLKVRGTLSARTYTPRPLPRGPADPAPAHKGDRGAYSETGNGMVPFAVYDRYKMEPGMVVHGPAIIEERESTTVVDAGGVVEVDDFGTLDISVGQTGAPESTSKDLNLDVVWPRLISIADEMAVTQIRTAFSHDVIEVHDMSTGICDARGYLVAQTNLGATGHTGTMPPLVKTILEEVSPERMRPGDAYVTNDPWVQSGHTGDVFVVTPAFHRRRLVGFAVTSIHHLDIGGRAGSGLTQEVYEEGLIIPILPIMREGVPNDDFFSILRRNVRFSEKVVGDFRAQVATGYVGARRLTQLLDERNLESLEGVADEIVARSETVMRRGIATLGDGTYKAGFNLDMLDDSGAPLRLALGLTVRGDGLHADFTGTSAQVRRPINDPLNHVRAFFVEAVKTVCAPDIPNNEGSHRPITTTAPEGCLLNPTYPAPVFWRIATGTPASDLAFMALSQAAPDRTPAGSGSLPICQFYNSGLRRSGEPFLLHQHAFGGMGGRPGRDGLASVSFPNSVREVSTEAVETETPLLYERREIMCDSGGAGQWRGGAGEVLVMRAVPGGDVAPGSVIVFSGSGGRFTEPPHGVLGGSPGAIARILVDGEAVDPASLGNSPEVHFRADQVLTVELPGGGGYGDPRRRDPRLVQEDLRGGYISRERALRDYDYQPEVETGPA
ncbi:MAG: hydantoinase B/oxoprolinase family protein [Dehalococcoidia bacterium]|nr:hydantoinase B/oxoprolinase family protein [Dehalococcoidia bacterium]